MTNIKQKLREDKALRDDARALVEAGVEQVRTVVSSGQLKGRATEQVSGKANKAVKVAGKTADQNKEYIAAAAGALILWLARKPIMALIDTLSEKLNEESSNPTEEAPSPNHEETP